MPRNQIEGTLLMPVRFLKAPLCSLDALMTVIWPVYPDAFSNVIARLQNPHVDEANTTIGGLLLISFLMASSPPSPLLLPRAPIIVQNLIFTFSTNFSSFLSGCGVFQRVKNCVWCQRVAATSRQGVCSNERGVRRIHREKCLQRRRQPSVRRAVARKGL